MNRKSPSIKATVLISLITVGLGACSQILPIVEDAIRIICRVTPHDAGVNVSIERVYPDGATEAIDATVIERD